ncbi:PD-(D/E)XK motif protein [Mycobacteroides salmoniphilum]|uniref:PD-(D/E)XK motif protein n=1 Tax=Mycobacteroides salmoniphilum TaxID=404941 RepID=UPI001430CD24|nr:PD-(D/E)XK motif protein [Mycobacteroides salmoniphilum]
MRLIPNNQLSNRWAVLGQTSNDAYLLSSRLTSKSGRDLRIAVDRAGNRHLLVRADSSDQKVPEDVLGAVLLSRRQLTFDTPAMYLDIQCVRADLFDVFDDLLSEVTNAVDADGGADEAIEVVDRWRSLLAVRGRQHLSNSAQRGLIAELHVLRLAQSSHLVDVEMWRGPLGEPHDIIGLDFAIEVKALGEHSKSVEIHGPEQLAEPGRPLALVLVELTEDPSGQTVHDAAEALVQNANDRDLATSRLAMVGYSSLDANAYTTRFRVQQLRHLVVSKQTPRIVPASFSSGLFPYGITYITYGLDVQNLQKELIVGETALTKWLSNQSQAQHGHSQ